MKFSAAITFAILAVACSPKTEKTVAIDVLLTPSSKMHEKAVSINKQLKQNYNAGFSLDENHVPHITLLQCYVFEKDLPAIFERLQGSYESIKEENLLAEAFYYSKENDPSFAMINIQKSEPLLKLHEEVIKRVRPFMAAKGDDSAFIQNPDGSSIGKFTVDYVNGFLNESCYDKYNPHVTVGVAKKDFLDSLSTNRFEKFEFTPTSLSVYQLGDNGTAQKLLWQEN
ncbi:2'-5' RNA ligase family protein [Aequorivita echinoideorum]|uniref:2'-5' RNA ligase family protein n=1 Tax=Aequorivita echinoideorum TaxID=1549647 RepID=A0ABS5S6Z3_9FLAO|nr:2'-5' RNA ligase family protein [Aequorivita echinoideorum]MBT0608189.1 2'-5' RNA ligase family protein [Aequorivita echinoideorum]